MFNILLLDLSQIITSTKSFRKVSIRFVTAQSAYQLHISNTICTAICYDLNAAGWGAGPWALLPQ